MTPPDFDANIRSMFSPKPSSSVTIFDKKRSRHLMHCDVCKKIIRVAEYVLKNQINSYDLCSFACLEKQVKNISEELENDSFFSDTEVKN